MHIAYSAINSITLNSNLPAKEQDDQNNSEIILRYLAYQTVCDKYCNEIASIQKYIPGWTPKFRQ